MLQTYLNQLNPPELAISVKNTVDDFMEKLSQTEPKTAQNVLLLGNVQSGKTAQVLGILSALADRDFKLFIYLTTDSVDLQQQTLKRAEKSLDKFIILSENDDSSFMQVMKANNPILVVIKKNARVLKRWRNLFASQSSLKGYPLVIVDDEADAASLNTNADKPDKDASTINKLLNDIKNSCCQSLFIQLTATPQSLLLQHEESDWQPEFIHFFEAGEKYIGGNFVFSDPPSYIVRFIDSELDDMKDESGEIAEGAKQALLSFLITCAEFALCDKTNCNFALHPSYKIQDHQAFSKKIQAFLNDLVQAVNNGEDLAGSFKESYLDLQKTKPDIHHFDEIYEKLTALLENQQISTLVINSQTEADFDLEKGFNIIIGGNVIGRGLTIPKLQTVYYSRTAKKPNADTFWQHSRIFGYDRDKSLLRLYIPSDVYHFFVQLNQANNLIIEQAKKSDGNIQVIYPKNINPTRKNVLKAGSINQMVGGVNYFPLCPNENNLLVINGILSSVLIDKVQSDLYQINIEDLFLILDKLGNYVPDDWDKEKFIAGIEALKTQRPTFKIYVLVKTGRNLSRATGTMLSEEDRKLGEKYPNDLFLTLYQIVGNKDKGWQGKDFWLPNIKLPHKGLVYWGIK
ncbi:MAG: Z1 domain-containing protein [Haemophilus parainfluenzae]|jgi:stress-sensitive restriction system protein|uniref:DEAD/DEAH box helicase n=1 Tax=Haemophilus parainfluenzae TaxID=729 RepID=A0AB37IXN4_HAEPA|nr:MULTISPECIES: Z1 domain-containing protein [Haemophilus]MDU4565855.1 Z1 domain-containing protein [Haemophilus parainfluenzae]MDU4637635.1 Z1 domain-containing protein [Haemophilus parainfluenzae]MDU5009282.1 Z1 domain-containing protein [Haemophilus parainfluenzae]MDU5990163.1 Z1 domain-containing protein [Haemophilus parainfluenzae]MDU7968848.1 Z1 domain-containing protein [Haemophilus parainfluenzae]